MVRSSSIQLSQYSRLAMKASKKMARTKDKKRSGRVICHHLLRMLAVEQEAVQVSRMREIQKIQKIQKIQEIQEIQEIKMSTKFKEPEIGNVQEKEKRRENGTEIDATEIKEKRPEKETEITELKQYTLHF